MKYTTQVFAVALVVLAVSGCINEDADTEAKDDNANTETTKKTNRIDLPANVRQNLGIRFAKVEKRMVSKTIRLPGTFELPKESCRTYTTRLAGQVELLVKQYDTVKIGDPLYSIAPLEWPEAREELQVASMAIAEAQLAANQSSIEAKAYRDPAIEISQQQIIASFKAQIDGVQTHLADLESERLLAEERVSILEDLIVKGAGKATDLAEAKLELAQSVSAISEEQKNILTIKQSATEYEATILDRSMEAAKLGRLAETATSTLALQQLAFDAHLRTAEMKFGLATNTLTEGNWQTINAATVSALNAGTVTTVEVTSGQWLEPQADILSVKDLTKLRFRAHALQSDLGLLEDDLPATIVPPAGSSIEEKVARLRTELDRKAANKEDIDKADKAYIQPIVGLTVMAPESDPVGRISEVLIVSNGAGWARNGIRAEVEIVYDQTEEAEFAIPVKALVRDGLDLVYFKRAPEDEDKVIRMVAKTLGPSDGVWVVLYGGIGSNTEVVVEGAYELKLTSSAGALKGGHFHADGTFHAGDDH